MTDFEKVINWLNLCPFMQTFAMLTDTTIDWPITAGLYPKGQKIVKEINYITGGRKSQIQQTYLLRFALPEGDEAAKRLQKIQNWIFTQNINGDTPGLGEKESVKGSDGCLERATQVGMRLYVMTLTVEYEKISEGE